MFSVTVKTCLPSASGWPKSALTFTTASDRRALASWAWAGEPKSIQASPTPTIRKIAFLILNLRVTRNTSLTSAECLLLTNIDFHRARQQTLLFTASLNFDDCGQTRHVSLDSFDARSKLHIVFVDVIIPQNLVFDELATRIFNLRVQ